MFARDCKTSLSAVPVCAPIKHLCLIELSQEERYLFDFFLNRASPSLAGFHDHQLWGVLVPQACHINPVTRRMVFAISCLYNNPSYTEHGHSPCTLHAAQIEALEFCNQSLKALRCALAGGSDQSCETVLLSCVLLSALQFQQNDVPNAVRLLRAGFNFACKVISGGYSMSTDLEVLVRTVLRQGVLMSIFGCVILPHQIKICWQHVSKAYTTMEDLTGAREYLCACMLQAVTFMNSVATTRYQKDADHLDEAVHMYADQQKDVLILYTRWCRQLMLLTAKSSVDTTSKVQRAISSLMIYYHISWIWTIACLARSSLVLDGFTQQFGDVLLHADNILQTVSPNEQPFTFEMGVIAPLSFVAGHCRHPILRREAIALIRRASKREALFTAEHSARAAELIVSLEETPELRRQVELGTWDGTLPGQPDRCQYVNEAFKDQVPERKRPSMHYLQPQCSTAGTQIGWMRHTLALYRADSGIVV